MADAHQNFSSHGSQIYVFKVAKINCCDECPEKLKKGLKRLHGIESVNVDATQCLATVKGVIDSTVIIDKIKKWGKKAELVHDRKETNPHGYNVELTDEDEDEEGENEDLSNASGRHKDSSFRHKDSSSGHKDSSFRRQRDSSFRKHDKNKGSSHATEKPDNSENNASTAKEIPDHICRDKYCTFHRRDNSTTFDGVPNMNYGTSYSPLYRGSGNYNYPMMNSYAIPPPMYDPQATRHYGQYYGPRMVPPVAGYGSHAMHRQMPGPRPNGNTDFFSDEYSNSCNNM